MHLLFGKPSTSERRTQHQVLHLEHLPVPVHIFLEKRRNSRISLLKEKIHLRLPRSMSGRQRSVEVRNLLQWAEAHIAKKKMYGTPVAARDYTQAYSIELAGIPWQVVFQPDTGRRDFRGSVQAQARSYLIEGDETLVRTSEGARAFRALLVRLVRRSHALQMADLVSEINDKTLQKPIEKVTLKDMSSRWGSCSVRKNINLSVRLLLLPEAVMRYVILHELAHLREMNHSPRFWKIVADHMPEYKNYEKWLKQHGHTYDF